LRVAGHDDLLDSGARYTEPCTGPQALFVQILAPCWANDWPAAKCGAVPLGDQARLK
jgi:hypothetical protein